MEPIRKLAKRRHLILTEGNRQALCWSQHSNEQIWKEHQHFQFALKHLKGSEHPKGWFDAGYGSGDVTVEWSYTESLGYYAPRIEFDASVDACFETAKVLAKAFKDMHYGNRNPELLIVLTKATVVEYVSYNTYKPLRVPGESALMTLARAAT